MEPLCPGPPPHMGQPVSCGSPVLKAIRLPSSKPALTQPSWITGCQCTGAPTLTSQRVDPDLACQLKIRPSHVPDHTRSLATARGVIRRSPSLAWAFCQVQQTVSVNRSFASTESPAMAIETQRHRATKASLEVISRSQYRCDGAANSQCRRALLTAYAGTIGSLSSVLKN